MEILLARIERVIGHIENDGARPSVQNIGFGVSIEGRFVTQTGVPFGRLHLIEDHADGTILMTGYSSDKNLFPNNLGEVYNLDIPAGELDEMLPTLVRDVDAVSTPSPR